MADADAAVAAGGDGNGAGLARPAAAADYVSTMSMPATSSAPTSVSAWCVYPDPYGRLLQGEVRHRGSAVDGEDLQARVDAGIYDSLDGIGEPVSWDATREPLPPHRAPRLARQRRAGSTSCSGTSATSRQGRQDRLRELVLRCGEREGAGARSPEPALARPERLHLLDTAPLSRPPVGAPLCDADS